MQIPTASPTVRIALCIGLSIAGFGSVEAQAFRFPPDSLSNTRVIPHATPVIQVVGTMRNFSTDLGVRCQFCHVGQEGQPLEEFNFVTDEKRTKLVARQMMLMVAEINRRVDSLPGRAAGGWQVTCSTCLTAASAGPYHSRRS